MGPLQIQDVFAIITGLVAVLVLTPVLTRPAERLGLMDTPGGRKRHATAVPLTGGLAMFAAFCISLLVIDDPMRPYASMVVGMGILLVVGLMDDIQEITVASKMVAQIMAAVLMVSWGGVQIHSLGDLFGTGVIELGEWAIPFTVLCTLVLINAVNMADGFDGLAGGMTAVALFWLAAASHANGAGPNFLTIVLTLLFIVVGFLVYNMRGPWRQRAASFMGDSGSMMLGFAIAWIAVYLTQKPDATVYPISIAWVLALPVIDLVSLCFRRVLRGRSPFSADREHLHHIFLRVGYSVPTTVGTFLLFVMLFGLIGFAGWYLQWPESHLFWALLAVFALHYYFTTRAWRLMRLLRRRFDGK
jgi:UDP-GlcNAc:undecaprenyl-phosphate GlcNAc-1-phosphate transferase